MKIRDVLVIVFTAIVALLLFCRAARASGSGPQGGVGGGSQSTSTGAGADWNLASGLADWICADECAAICGDRCHIACLDVSDPTCVSTCYPVCAEDCYGDCLGPSPASSSLPLGVDPGQPSGAAAAGVPASPALPAITTAPAETLGCYAAPGASTFTLLNGVAALGALAFAARRRRR